LSSQNDGQIDLTNLPPVEDNNKRSGLSTGCIILAVVGGIFILMVPCIVIVVLALLGPAIGNVFSNIVLTL